MLKGILISLTGFVVVFLMLFILYFITHLLGMLGRKASEEDAESTKGDLENEDHHNNEQYKSDDDQYKYNEQYQNDDYYEDIVAISAAISLMLNTKNFKVNRIQRVEVVNHLWNNKPWKSMFQYGRGKHEEV